MYPGSEFIFPQLYVLSGESLLKWIAFVTR